MPPRDAHMRHLDVSSFLGPTSGVERWIGSTTRQRGASGGEFLQQGFAYTQSGGRERGGAAGRLGLEEEVCGEGAPQPSLYRGGAASPCSSSKPWAGGQGREEWGARTLPLLEALTRVLSACWPAGPYGACAPGPMRPGHSLIGPCPLPTGGTMLVPLRKVLEASGTIPINPQQFRTPKTALPYMNLILWTIPEPLVMSRIPSETPNKNS